MNKSIHLLILIFISAVNLRSQSCQDVTVELYAEVQSSPPRITLHWTPNAGASQHIIYRKLKSATSWGTVIAALSGPAISYVDSTILPGVSYEYRVTRSGSNYIGYGYINAGIEIASVEHRGAFILVLDSTIVLSLTMEIERLIRDLEGDGWSVFPLIVDREAAVTEVKARIITAYEMYPGIPKALFLLGHVPVPYSGELNPDGHTDHLGAWSTDVYYADINGTWTDSIISNAKAVDVRNRNIPGDGKFDQSLLPSDVEMPVGRVDFANMPAFAASETELLKNYLDKNHAYRHKEFSPMHRMLIDDNFGFFGSEAFAANGWKTTPLVGGGNVQAGDYFTDLTNNSYLWSYGCGGGWFSGAGGIGSTTDFANSDLQSVFTMLFGSYFGDWDSQDNFLRAALAQGKTLTNVWGGRPHWIFHHMGLGETIGYSTQLSQNNSGLYFSGFGVRGIQMGLMGDPSLRNDVVDPVSEVIATLDGTDAHLSWKASSDTVLGYYVYAKKDDTESYLRINELLVTGTSYVDSCLFDPGIYTYMIRALVLHESPSGTYYNLSQGISDTVMNTNDLTVSADATWSSFAGVVNFENLSINATEYAWSFGDGTESSELHPEHTFIDGEYLVTLIASNGCDADTILLEISISTGVSNLDDPSISISPNPSTGRFWITQPEAARILIYNVIGELIFEDDVNQEAEIDLSAQPAGIYRMSILNDEHRYSKNVAIQR